MNPKHKNRVMISIRHLTYMIFLVFGMIAVMVFGGFSFRELQARIDHDNVDIGIENHQNGTEGAGGMAYSSPYAYAEDMIYGWTGGAPVSVTSDTMKAVGTKKQYRLVISHCDKPLDWIYEKFIRTRWDQSRISSITVYSKCGNPVEGAPDHDNLKIVRLPNVGRCDHSYAHWMANEINSIPTKEDKNTVVIFMKDNGYQLNYWRPFISLISLTYVNGFTCAQVTRHERDQKYSIYHNTTLIQQFSKRYHARQGKINELTKMEKDKMKDFPSPYESLGSYVRSLGIPLPETYMPVCYGGVFAVTLDCIRKQPQSLWQSLDESLTRGDNIEEGHFVERLWAALLTKWLSEKSISLITETKTGEGCGPQNNLLNHCGIVWKTDDHLAFDLAYFNAFGRNRTKHRVNPRN